MKSLFRRGFMTELVCYWHAVRCTWGDLINSYQFNPARVWKLDSKITHQPVARSNMGVDFYSISSRCFLPLTGRDRFWCFLFNCVCNNCVSVCIQCVFMCVLYVAVKNVIISKSFGLPMGHEIQFYFLFWTYSYNQCKCLKDVVADKTEYLYHYWMVILKKRKKTFLKWFWSPGPFCLYSWVCSFLLSVCVQTRCYELDGTQG